jgi:hypothetical protein
MDDIRSRPAVLHNKMDPVEPGFQDWAHFVSFQPRLYFRPQDLEELKSFLTSISQGAFKQIRPRVLGGLHSCSDIFVSDAIIDVSDLPRTIEFNSDYSKVTVSANWHFHDFLLALSEHGKSISATGGTDEQTLAGIISTNTAPATPHTTIYELLEWVEYITVDAEHTSIVEKRVYKTDPGFRAAIGSLGAIGVLTKVQFNLINELYFETVQKIIDLNTVLADVAKTSQKYDFWRIDWIPNTDQGLLWAATKIPPSDPDGDYPMDQSENILEEVFKMLDKFGSAGPILDNSMRLLYSGLIFTYGEIKVNGPLRNMLPVDRRAPLRVAMAEWSFNPADLENLMQRCREYFKQHGWPNLPIEIELTKTDNYYMSAWNWPGLDYIIKFNFMYLTDVAQTTAEKEMIIDHLHGLWDYLIQAGIPFKAHWGKINFMDPKFVNDHFEFDQFKPFIRPMFLNRYLEERFYQPTLPNHNR